MLCKCLRAIGLLVMALPAGAGMRDFARAELEAAWKARGHSGAPPVRLAVEPRAGAEQSYSVKRAGAGGWLVTGAGEAGAMYGGLELAEAIRIGALDRTREGERRPHIARRGIKFNIPLDARTPSYSDNSDSAQQNIAEMWSFDFWREFLDEMARHRYNVLSLWSLHPFPSIVKIPEYPQVALDDVMRTTIRLDDTYSHNGTDMVRPETLANLRRIKQMTIDEKIAFWRRVMEYARDRGVDVYWFTWNIFAFGAQGKHGITGEQNDPVTLDYFRKSVRQTVLTYPLLAGMGITAGERMENRQDDFAKEKWLWKAYGEGIRDALRQQPDREFRLIHRFHQTGFAELQREWKDYPGPFDVSFKYSIAHMYSSPKPPFIESALPLLGPRLKTWLTVRNDDIYSFRWGDAAYARAYILNMPGPDKLAGFYMGPDGYNWGRDFLSRQTDARRPLVIERQWFSFLLWGRLAYDPALSDERLERIVAARLPGVAAPKLMAAWAAASRVIPASTRFLWGDIDLRWYPEANLSHRRHKGWYTVRHYIEGETMPGSGNVDILTWREKTLAGREAGGTTPLEVAADLRRNAAAALAALPALKAAAPTGGELAATLHDIEAMAELGNYYAAKIEGASELALFDATGETARQARAIERMDAALAAWRRYARLYGAQYKPQLLNRIGFVDIPALESKAAEDVAIARSWRPGTVKQARKDHADVPFRK